MAVASDALGIPGYSFADLHDPERLSSLYERVCEEVQASDPALWVRWDAYRRSPDAPRPPVALSNLLIDMAPHVSRFVGRLFDVDAPASALAESTRAQNDLFRFKVDFVRRRALPLLKGGAHVVSTPEDDAIVERLIAQSGGADRELAVARAGCHLLDLEKATSASRSTTTPDSGPATNPESRIPNPDTEALKRWCAARVHQRAYRGWVIFRFPENVEPFQLVEVQRPDASLPEAMIGPGWRLRRRDGFTLTDPRMKTREVLSEIHYCVLCHERDKDSCSKGLHEKDGRVTVNALGIELDGCPLDEKISEMHALRKQGDAIGALALVAIDNPMCPGTGHRICNDCMKSCIYQKQEPVNIPQIETGVLTDVLSMPWGVEIYGLLTRWNPLNVRRPFALPYNGKNVLVVGLGPAGYTLAHYLVNEGFGVVGIDGLKIEPLPDELTGANGDAPRPIRDWSDDLHAPRRSRARRLRRRVRVRHHGALGQELPHAAASDAGAAPRPADVRRRALRRHDADRRRVGVRVRSRGDRGGRRQADDHRHEEQPDPRDQEGERLPDGAAAHWCVQTQRAAEPAGARAGGRHRRRPDRDRHGHGADGVLPAARREDARAATRRCAPGSARRVRAACTTRRSWRCSTSTSRTAVPCAPNGRAPPTPARRRISSRSSAHGAASRSRIASAWSTLPPTASTTKK